MQWTKFHHASARTNPLDSARSFSTIKLFSPAATRLCPKSRAIMLRPTLSTLLLPLLSLLSRVARSQNTSIVLVELLQLLPAATSHYGGVPESIEEKTFGSVLSSSMLLASVVPSPRVT
jgi:hypothetical protein